jgi:SAM-dependent methyltransferase
MCSRLPGMAGSLPLPPFDLATRVGSLLQAEDPWETFENHGRAARAAIGAAVGTEWDWRGKRVLDFGAGVGRTLRHFADELDVAEFHACDIDAPSVAWMNEHLRGVQAFTNGELPPLDRPDATFDLVFSVSVFTHLLEAWTEWLLELRRVIKPGGLLVISFMGVRESESLAGIPWDEDRVGMFAFAAGQSWDAGGPMVMHSPWWIREHWGRAFDVVGFVPSGEADPWFIHGLAVLRHPGTPAPTAEELRRPGEDPREAPALAHNLDYVHRESAWLRGEVARVKAGAVAAAAAPQGTDEETERELRRLQAENADLRAVLARRDAQIEVFATSASWRLTAPLRAGAERLRRARS